MGKSYKSELVGVLGHPVSENPSIVMQEAAFQHSKLDWRYLTLEVYPQDLETAINGVRAFNMQGVNLTIPHKVEVLKYLDEISPDAQLIGAVNTVRRVGDKLIGENTDGKGFLRALQEDANLSLMGKRIVVLGAGGAARAITVELALAGVAYITVVNRSVERGQTLVALLNDKTPAQAQFVAWDKPYNVPDNTDVVINATSIGLEPHVDQKPNLNYNTLTASMVVCDAIPNPPQTLFLKEAQARGAQTLDGLGMLVYQGIIGFKMWTGVDGSVQVMREALSNAFGL